MEFKNYDPNDLIGDNLRDALDKYLSWKISFKEKEIHLKNCFVDYDLESPKRIDYVVVGTMLSNKHLLDDVLKDDFKDEKYKSQKMKFVLDVYKFENLNPNSLKINLFGKKIICSYINGWNKIFKWILNQENNGKSLDDENWKKINDYVKNDERKKIEFLKKEFVFEKNVIKEK